MNVYSPQELRSKIASHDYGAELCLQHAMANIEALEMAVEALSKDAERYRWLRDHPWPPELEADTLLHRNARWDAAIDAAIAAAPAVGAA